MSKITENLSTLKIHKLTQAQYDRELAAGNIDPSALYLTPDDEKEIYVQSYEPQNVPDNTLWLDTDAVSSDSSSGGYELMLDTNLNKSGYAADAKAVGDALSFVMNAVGDAIDSLRSYVDSEILGGEW